MNILETNVLGEWRTDQHRFPIQPERSRFNRRRRNLMGAINHIRQITLAVLDVAEDKQCVIDSLPIPVVRNQKNEFWLSITPADYRGRHHP